MPSKRHGKSFRRVKRKTKRVDVYTYSNMLRNRMTNAELKLWVNLQRVSNSWGVVFEAQGVVASRFVADFVCREKRLIVELDGSIHRLARVRAKDKYRSMVLINLGYSILRFDNKDVFFSCDKVLKKIKRACS